MVLSEAENILPSFLEDLEKGTARHIYESMWTLGVKEKGRKHYWDTLVSVVIHKPKVLPLFFSLSIQGYHLRKVTRTIQSKNL